MYYVYVLLSESTDKIYIGQTNNTVIREKRHNNELPSKSRSYTHKNKGPWRIVYTEKFATRKEAMRREKELKSSRGRAYIREVLTKGR